MLTGSRMLISNDYELEMIVRITGLSRSELLERTGGIVTTLGDKGSLLQTSEGEQAIGTIQARQVLDPTGAGDAYRAGLIKGMVMGRSLSDSVRMGAVCASFCVECKGTQCHSFTEQEFWARYEANFGLVS